MSHQSSHIIIKTTGGGGNLTAPNGVQNEEASVSFTVPAGMTNRAIANEVVKKLNWLHGIDHADAADD
jgi:hypothetical protein